LQSTIKTKNMDIFNTLANSIRPTIVTKTKKKPVFYQAVLKKVEGNVYDLVYPHLQDKEQVTHKERLGDENACCSECGNNEWMLLANESIAVKQGGKPYIECLTCGLQTHL
jgi:hypothetical protein